MTTSAPAIVVGQASRGRPGSTSKQVDLASYSPTHFPQQRGEAGTCKRALRRFSSILGGLAILLAALPVCVILAALIKLDSPGPILYRQSRLGLNGKEFGLIKFRSMGVNAEAAGPQWAMQGDPRVTRLGRLMRKSRLDELPQVLNVLSGSMNFVGPRPERPEFMSELERLVPHFGDRLAVKPGITGWAQVNYPYGASIEDARAKLSFDLYYIQNKSFLLDLRIVFTTLWVMARGHGAR